MNDNLNRLKQYMEFFKANGGTPSAYVGRNGGSIGPSNSGWGDARGAVAYTPAFAMNWATKQMEAEDQQANRRPPQDFFSGQNALQGIMGQSPYIQPQTVGGENPYMPRAMELTGANYLKRMFGGNPGPRGGTTNGVRG